jgi:hypothetical protein
MSKAKSKKSEYRNRIKDLRYVKASSLSANPHNWRTHPKAQQDALLGLLAEIGYADALLARELSDGTLELIDGHLRAETTPDQIVPVLVLDLDEDEAKKLLTTLDPLAAMAEANKDALGQLLHEIETESEGVQTMLDELAKQNGIDLLEPLPPEDFAIKDENIEVQHTCPKCGYQWSGGE